jgi:hypothetical protein
LFIVHDDLDTLRARCGKSDRGMERENSEEEANDEYEPVFHETPPGRLQSQSMEHDNTGCNVFVE